MLPGVPIRTMNFKRKLYIKSFTLLFYILCCSDRAADGQTEIVAGAGATTGVLINQAEELIKKLENAGTTLGGNGSKLVDGAVSRLSDLVNQLRAIIKDDLSLQIDKLSGVALETSRRLQDGVERMNEIANIDSACLILHSEEFLAALKTTTLRLEDAMPFVKQSSPLIYAFRFDGHSTNVVPKSGGRLTLRGFRLYEQAAPTITLWDASRKTKIADLAAERASDVDSASTVIPGDIIANHPGESLQLEVATKEKPLFGGERTSGDVFLPFVIPSAYGLLVRAKASISYDLKGHATKQLEGHQFRFVNTSCEERLSINNSRFTYPIPSDWRIISIASNTDNGGREKSQIEASYSNDTISVSGWLDTANCITIHLLFTTIHRLQDPAVWDHTITPTVEYPSPPTPQSEEQNTDYVPFDGQIILPVALRKDHSDQTTFWFTIFFASTTGGHIYEYTSRHATTGESQELHLDDTYNGFHISCDFNPTVTSGGVCSARIAVTGPQQCGY
jgi:hypothetical protein